MSKDSTSDLQLDACIDSLHIPSTNGGGPAWFQNYATEVQAALKQRDKLIKVLLAQLRTIDKVQNETLDVAAGILQQLRHSQTDGK